MKAPVKIPDERWLVAEREKPLNSPLPGRISMSHWTLQVELGTSQQFHSLQKGTDKLKRHASFIFINTKGAYGSINSLDEVCDIIRFCRNRMNDFRELLKFPNRRDL